MPFFVHRKVQIALTNLPQIPIFASFSQSENEPFQHCYCCKLFIILWSFV